jgi:prepilin-type N-terminal cleavage/methylation domain-containing protein
MPPRPMGFTLVELLVVITIIVVLLALLTPALDRAIYQAELAVCGAQIKAVAGGLTVYAMDHKRRYVDRGSNEGWDVNTLAQGMASTAVTALGPAGAQAGDLRPQLRRYVTINKHLVDPFAEPVDLEAGIPGSIVYGSYHLLAGWRYSNSPNAFNGMQLPTNSGMLRMGDRLTFGGFGYSTLAADADHFNLNEYAMASHPDDAGMLVSRVLQNQELVTGAASPAPTATSMTVSWWDRPFFATGYPPRGLIDRNVGFTDGSVERFDRVAAPATNGIVHEPERFANLPWSHDGGGSGDWPNYGIQIPRR